MIENSFWQKVFIVFIFLYIISPCWSQAIVQIPSKNDSLSMVAQRHFEAGEQKFRNEDYESALAEFQKAAELGIENYKAYEKLVDAYLRLKKDKEAQQYVDSFLTRKSKNPLWIFAKGYLVYSKENFNEALVLFNESAKLKPDFAKALLLIGFAEYRVGNLKDGLAATNIALKLFQKSNNETELGSAYRWSGYLLGKLGRKTEGIGNLEKARAIFQKLGDQLNESKCLNLMGILYKDIQLYGKAILCYERSLKQSRLIKNKRAEANTLGNLGTLYLAIGDYNEALRNFYAALPLFEQIQFLSALGTLYNNIAIIKRSLNDYEEAVKYVNKSMDLNEKRNYKLGLFQNYQTLGIIYRNQGDFSKAFDLFEKALSLSEESGDILHKADILRTIGNAYKRQRKFDDALENLFAARRLFREAKNHLQLSYTLNDIAQIQAFSGDFTEAEKSIKAGLQVADKHKLSLAKYHLHDTEAFLLNSKGQYLQAKESSLKALGILKAFYYKTPVGSSSSFYLDNKINTYDVLINNLVNLEETREAFKYSEEFKVQGLLTLVGKGNPLLSGDIPDELYVKVKHLEKEIVNTNIELSQTYSKAALDEEKAESDSLNQRLQFLKDEFQNSLDIIQIYNANYAKIENQIQGIQLDKLQSLLSDEDALVEYFVGEENLYIWVVRKNFFQCESLPLERNDLIKKIQDFRQPFADLKAGKIKSITEMAFDVKLAHELYQIVFQPLEKHLTTKTKNLIVVPHDILYYLPFSVLVAQVEDEPVSQHVLFSEYKNARFLLEKYAISYLQSANLLNPELWRRNPSKEFDGRLLAFGNPDFNLSLKQVRDRKTKNDSFDLLSFLFRSSNGWIFEPLPKSEHEVRNISEMFHPSLSFTRMDASEDNFKKYSSNYTMLHLATHSIVDDSQPLYSRIVFTQDDDPDEDGFLQTYEIFNLDLNADLVTLSACETGLGKLSKSEGFVGLTRAFMYAGARSLLVSLWSVDESTALLMEEFYGNLSRDQTKTKALRNAKLSVIGKTVKLDKGLEISLAHPFYWAPFVLFGNHN